MGGGCGGASGGELRPGARGQGLQDSRLKADWLPGLPSPSLPSPACVGRRGLGWWVPGETCEFRGWSHEGYLPTAPGLRPGPQPAETTPSSISESHQILSQTQNAVIPSEERPEGAIVG